jgi:hypothetical protein
MGAYFAGGQLTFTKLVEDLAAGGVGQGPEDECCRSGIYILSNLAS